MTSPTPQYAGGSTPWNRYEVPALAGFLDEDLSPSWSQVTAWWLAHDLTVEHLRVMQQARDTVVRAWPPAVSEASQAFLDQLDALIASMESMRDAAAANGQALGGILTVLTNAKKSVDDLHDLWKAVPSTTEIDKALVTGLVTGNTGEAAQAYAMSKVQADLNVRAQEVMRQTDQSVYEYLPKLVVVQPLSTQSSVDAFTPYSPRPSTGGSGQQTQPHGSSAPPPTIPPAAPPVGTEAGRSATGPTLSASTPLGPDSVRSDNSGAPQTTVPGSDPSAGRTVLPAPVPSAWVETPAGKVLRSGAVLGALQEVVPSNPGAPRNTVDQPRTTGGSPTEAEGGLWGAGMGAGLSSRRTSEHTLPRDTEWSVPRGVPPVLEPGPEPVHDPGPGVIGIDR